MSNKHYEKGYELENLLVNVLLKNYKFQYAQRTAGSHSVADVIGVSYIGTVIFFQCKCTEKQLTGLTEYYKDANVQKLLKLPEHISKALIIKEYYKGKPVIHYYLYELDNWKKIDINFKIEKERK